MSNKTFGHKLHEFSPPKRFSVLDGVTLSQISDDLLVTAIVDFILGHPAGRDVADRTNLIDRLPAGFRAIYATWLVHAEVCNGGFNQFFHNWGGAYADDALEGSRRIGAMKSAALMEQAIATFKKEIDFHAKVIEDGSIEAFRESYKHTNLTQLDEPYYETGEDIRLLQIQYIRAHVQEFITCPAQAITLRRQENCGGKAENQ